MNKADIFQHVRLNDINALKMAIGSIDINIVNESGQSLLHEAAVNNSVKCAQELLDKGIDSNIKDNKGMTALHYSAANNSVDVAVEIIGQGGDLSIFDDYGNQPLWTAVFNARGQYKMVELFINYKANSNHKNNSDKSPIDFAKQINDQNLVAILR